jgi:hypothetical protein
MKVSEQKLLPDCFFLLRLSWDDLINLLTSIKNKPLDVSCSDTGVFSRGLVKVWDAQSILASIARISVLLMRNGVPPGTTATLRLRGPIGITKAWLLLSVP